MHRVEFYDSIFFSKQKILCSLREVQTLFNDDDQLGYSRNPLTLLFLFMDKSIPLLDNSLVLTVDPLRTKVQESPQRFVVIFAEFL